MVQSEVEDFDVIVLGGCPGGASAATILARAGKRVVVLERARFGNSKGGPPREAALAAFPSIHHGYM